MASTIGVVLSMGALVFKRPIYSWPGTRKPSNPVVTRLPGPPENPEANWGDIVTGSWSLSHTIAERERDIFFTSKRRGKSGHNMAWKHENMSSHGAVRSQ
ncbi:unnamed protein product [Boreogadus saida]